MSHPQSYTEGEAPDSQLAKSNRRSKVTSDRVALLVLCALLAAALIIIYRLSFEHVRTKEKLEEFKSLEQHGGKYYYFSIIKSSWEESRDECRANGGDLVKIDSEEEQIYLAQRLGYIMKEPEDKFWIGLTDSAKEGTWLWVDGSPLMQSLTYWSENEPDNWNGEYSDGEDCARMGERGGTHDLRSWFDASCKIPHRSICEKPFV